MAREVVIAMWEGLALVGGIGAVAALLRVVIAGVVTGVPVLSQAYRDHIDWRDERIERIARTESQAREIPAVSPNTGKITKRSA